MWPLQIRGYEADVLAQFEVFEQLDQLTADEEAYFALKSRFNELKFFAGDFNSGLKLLIIILITLVTLITVV